MNIASTCLFHCVGDITFAACNRIKRF